MQQGVDQNEGMTWAIGFNERDSKWGYGQKEVLLTSRGAGRGGGGWRGKYEERLGWGPQVWAGLGTVPGAHTPTNVHLQGGEQQCPGLEKRGKAEHCLGWGSKTKTFAKVL